MNWQHVERNWSEYKLNARTRWSRLSREDLDAIAGNRERLLRKICEAYGMSAEEAELQLAAWGEALRELRGAMTSANVAEGVLVTSGRFTPEAVGFAAKENIQLIDGAALLQKLAALLPEKALDLLKFATKGDFLTPTCPRCSVKMTARKSTREGRMFWGCTNYPRCKHTFSSATISPA